MGGEVAQAIAKLSAGRRRQLSKPCICGPNGTSAARGERSAPARSHPAPLQSRRLAALPATEGSGDVDRWPATRGFARIVVHPPGRQTYLKVQVYVLTGWHDLAGCTVSRAWVPAR